MAVGDLFTAFTSPTDAAIANAIKPTSTTLGQQSFITADITVTTDVNIGTAPGVNYFLNITNLLVTNSDATNGTFVNIKSGATTIWTGYAAANGGFSVNFDSTPLKGANNGIFAVACETAVNAVRVSIQTYPSL